jgi:hypothetical protein
LLDDSRRDLIYLRFRAVFFLEGFFDALRVFFFAVQGYCQNRASLFQWKIKLTDYLDFYRPDIGRERPRQVRPQPVKTSRLAESSPGH